jgi:hypothetical protein
MTDESRAGTRYSAVGPETAVVHGTRSDEGSEAIDGEFIHDA